MFGPDDKRLAEADGQDDGQGASAISLVAKTPGPYRLEVRLDKSVTAGLYEVKRLRRYAANYSH